METRLAIIGIIIENPEVVEALNAVLYRWRQLQTTVTK